MKNIMRRELVENAKTGIVVFPDEGTSVPSNYSDGSFSFLFSALCSEVLHFCYQSFWFRSAQWETSWLSSFTDWAARAWLEDGLTSIWSAPSVSPPSSLADFHHLPSHKMPSRCHTTHFYREALSPNCSFPSRHTVGGSAQTDPVRAVSLCNYLKCSSSLTFICKRSKHQTWLHFQRELWSEQFYFQ